MLETRNRYLLLPMGAIVVVLLSYALVAFAGTSADARHARRRPPSRTS